MEEPEQWGAIVEAHWHGYGREAGCGQTAMDRSVRVDIPPGEPCVMLRIRYPIFGGGYHHYWLCQRCGNAGQWADLVVETAQLTCLGYAVSTIPGLVESKQPPDQGHRFRFTVQSAGAYGVLAEGERTLAGATYGDADWWGQLRIVEVRAWDLPSAIGQMLVNVPFGTWVEDGHDE